MKWCLTALFPVFAICAAHAEDPSITLGNCYTAKGSMADRARLDCYDGAIAAILKANATKGAPTTSAPPTPPASQYRPIAFADLKVDAKELMGKRLSFTALIQTMGEISMLKSDELDMAPVWANVEHLPREDRKKLLNGCQVIVCSGQFNGTMQKGQPGFGPTVMIDSVTWR